MPPVRWALVLLKLELVIWGHLCKRQNKKNNPFVYNATETRYLQTFALARSKIPKTNADTLWPPTDRLTATVVWTLCQTLWKPMFPRGKISVLPERPVNIPISSSSSSDLLLAVQVEEQLCEIEPDDSTVHVEKMEKQSVTTEGESGSEHQEDLVEGDLGLGTSPALTREAWGSHKSPLTPAYQLLLPSGWSPASRSEWCHW